MTPETQIALELIGLIGTIISVFMTAKTTRDSVTAQLSTHQAVTDERISHLTDEVRKHNSVVERVYEAEKTIELHEAELKRQNKRIELLESKENNIA